jgi:8-oxo-dGTP pyrophosphatase MutT (NUDIX family)
MAHHARILQALRAHTPLGCDRQGLRAAAVLIPLLPTAEGLRILLIRRPTSMRTHAGQIALPGGGHDGSDVDLAATAVRETWEELGIEPSRVEILGQLDEVWTPSGYVMTPFVGWIESPNELRPNLAEVDEVVTTSVEELTAPGAYREELWDYEQKAHRMVFFDLAAGTVWGATSRILFRFLQIGLGWKAELDHPWESGPPR